MNFQQSALIQEKKEIIIIGAGWSGLSCAVKLAQYGHKVCVLESAHHAGGRARGVTFKHFLSNQVLDNGQHIMLGAYHETLSLFKRLNINETDILERQPLNFNLYSPKHSPIKLVLSKLPAPLHILMAFITMKGLTVPERFKIITMMIKLAVRQYKLKQDMSVNDLLQCYRQPLKTIQSLWEPLCLATLNTPIETASAQVFLNVLRDSFSRSRLNSDLLFFRQDLSSVFSSPAIDFICHHDGEIQYKEKVLKLHTDSKHSFSVKTSLANYKCQTIVIATPPHIADKLLSTLTSDNQPLNQKILKPYSASLNYRYEGIYTVYLQYPPDTRLPSRMVGFFDTIAQWAIDRSLVDQPGLIAIIISGPGKHQSMSHKTLAETVHSELILCLPNLPDVISYQVINEKRATFSCQVNIQQQRPENSTHINGLFLAGDYTNTHYPSTLEGAIRSGQAAAYNIIDENTN